MKRIIFIILLTIFFIKNIFPQSDSIYNKNIYVGLSNYLVTKYIPKSGTQIGKGEANQFLTYASYNGFTFYVWINYGFPENRITETDLAIFYDFNISENFLRGSLSGNIGFVEWIFPVWELQNEIIESNIKYNGWLNLNLLITQMLKDKDVEFGTRLHLKFSKDISLKIGKMESVLTPMVTSAFHFSFYDMDGLAHITPGLEYTLILNRLKISAHLNGQASTNNINVEKTNFLYSGIGLMLDF